MPPGGKSKNVHIFGERNMKDALCFLRVNVPAGYWFGIELDQPTGKHDGSVFGVRYFSCLPKYGVFAPPSRVQR